MWDRWLERIQARPVKVFYSLPHPTINYEEESTDTPRRIVRGRKVATTRFERELKKKKKEKRRQFDDDRSSEGNWFGYRFRNCSTNKAC